MSRNISISTKKLMLVEGNDEIVFFSHYFKHINKQEVQVVEVGGKVQFHEKLPIVVKDQNFTDLETLIVVRDADDDYLSAFNSVIDQLKINISPYYPSLNYPTQGGQIALNPGKLNIGVYIMPDNQGPGMLETLCYESVKSDVCVNCISAFKICIENQSSAKPLNWHKFFTQVFMATRKDIVSRVGHAAGKGYWDLSNSCMNSLKSFINQI